MMYPNDLEPKFPIDYPPRSVVSLVPSVTESLFDLNLGDRLIARTEYCVRPTDEVQNIETIGGTKNPNIDRIITLKPDLVIANQEENRREDVEALEAAGIPVWVTFPKIVPHVFNLLWDMMELFDETAMVPRIRLIEQTYDLFRNMAEANDHPARVFVPIWYEPLMTFNKDTYIHDLLLLLGAENVFAAHDTRYPRVSVEEIIAAQPDMILLPDEPFQFTEAHIPFFAQLDVPAAHHHRIHLVDGSLLTWHGTRIAYAMDQLPKLFRIDA